MHLGCDLRNWLTTKLQGKTIASSSISSVIPGILEQLQTFRCTEITHTRREGSKLACGLAKHAKFIEDFVTWIEETPPIVEAEITYDVILVLQEQMKFF